MSERAATFQHENEPPAPPSIPAEATPMMAQYLEIKAQWPDALLFYRMGDFYELFFEDAVAAAGALDIALTKRGKHLGKDIPMCGVPVHSHDAYLERLIRKGFKVAVCEQTEDPAEAKKRGSKSVVARAVQRLVTPGTLTEDTLLDARAHNYLAALAKVGSEGELGLAWADVSTGDFAVTSVSPSGLGAELARLSPGELLVPEGFANDERSDETLAHSGATLTLLPSARFDSGNAERRLKSHFAVSALDGFGAFSRAELGAMGALLDYVELTQVGRMPALAAPRRVAAADTMAIDAATRANLELVRTLQGETQGSLLATIDRTVTGAGARELASRLAAPLTDPQAINRRLDAVEWLLEARDVRRDLRVALKSAPDIARALSRLSLGRGGPRDLAAIAGGLAAAHALCGALDAAPPSLLPLPDEIAAECAAMENVAAALKERLSATLAEELPLIARDGGFIAKGASADLDETRALRDDARKLIAGLQAKYADETGISALKVRHNNVLGYYIEVPPRHGEKLTQAPFSETYIHRQTMANAMRFTTPELAGLASRIAEAAGRALEIELALFDELVAATLAETPVLARTAEALAALDVVAALAELAAERRHVRPRVDGSLAFRVVAGRHPVVEAALAKTGEQFVPNDCDLSADSAEQSGMLQGAASRSDMPDNDSRHDAPKSLWLLTGPNMAGKSTFLRQNALIAIMAQMGAFVPADEAHIGTVDRLFSRVGAADDLARGRSTFMVEMVETAAILNQAGPRSLVILDEIGRGTATFDGLSIAWAAVEHLHDVNRSRALFATHYHELTVLAEKLGHLANATMRVKEWKGDVVFLHEVGPGAADRSYGIQVAKLAGLPPPVIARAQSVLAALEKGNDREARAKLIDDLPLFSASAKPEAPQAEESAVEAELKSLNPDELTPKAALELIYRLKGLVKE
ncbi:MAG: DNA mismatch repair protein MutS [Parvibaculum sp.]|jgi:DNA mismatch repair protein MutS|uniref:DNA mismatch repair protein MutS n=1 Tax=Parvibaculum sp. TaxID=2024848 RepID=UPI000C4E8B85|nr:DNA mismatch repair protein MutS [Parvibaculum sp.]MAU61377.1 DNA mismatch repair protein MutS [Parvibaculum sp.]|tara:strand:- start:27558 stop:30350 length:2793 start_codon:yes stop_codon:yes gene_type:complete